MCSAEQDKVSIDIEPNDVQLARFPIVPMRAGEFIMDVIVLCEVSNVGDRVRKTLKVVVRTLFPTKIYKINAIQNLHKFKKIKMGQASLAQKNIIIFFYTNALNQTIILVICLVLRQNCI